MIFVKANTRRAVALSDDLITTSSSGIEVNIRCSEAWDGLTRIAIFRGSDTSVDVLLSGDSCTVPPQVLAKPGGPLLIGLYGSDGSGHLVIPTVWADAGRILPGAVPSGVEPTPEQQSALDQAINALNDAQDALEEATSQIAESGITPEERAKLAGIETGAEVNVIEEVRVFDLLRGYVPLPVTDKGVDLPLPPEVENVNDVVYIDFEVDETNLTVSCELTPEETIAGEENNGQTVIGRARLISSGKTAFLPLSDYLYGQGFYVKFSGFLDAKTKLEVIGGDMNNWSAVKTALLDQNAANASFVQRNQGSANSGKVLTVGADGAVSPQDAAGGQHIWWTDELTVGSPAVKSANVAYSLLHGPVTASSSTVSAGDYVIGPPFPENPQYGEEITGDPLWLYAVTLVGSGSSCSLKARVLIPEAVDMSVYRTADDQDAIDYQLGQAILGKLDVRQGTTHAGEFLVVGSDGNVTTKTMDAWQGGSY